MPDVDGGAQDDPWLSGDQQRDWASLVGLLVTLPAKLDAQLKQASGINFFEYCVLVALSEAPARTQVMSDLAAQSFGSLSRLSHAVSRLEGAGWVKRQSCAGSGRRTEASLTDEGWEQLRRAAPAHVREVRRLVIDAVSPRQLEQLGAAARQMAGAAKSSAAVASGSAGERSSAG